MKKIETNNYKQALVNQFGKEESTHANNWGYDLEDGSSNSGKVRKKIKRKNKTVVEAMVKIAQSKSNMDRKTNEKKCR